MEAVSLVQSAPVVESGNTPIEAGISSEHREFGPLYDKFQATSNPRTDRIFEELWNWAKGQAPLKDKDSILWELTKLSNKLGSVHYGEKPWSKLISYVSTYNQMKDSETRLKEMEISN